MLNISGSLNESSDIPLLDREKILQVSSCGHYRLLRQRQHATVRPQGRPDYQLLYVAGGSALFTIAGVEHRVPEGTVVLYRPDEPQRYIYELENSPDIYWMHFFGQDIEALLRGLRVLEEPLLRVPVSGEYVSLFDRIIRELQLKRENHQELCSLYALELLTLLSRNAAANGGRDGWKNEQVEKAIRWFHTRYGESLELASYARSCGMSPCWFTRIFHQQTGVSPQQYLTQVRIGKARELLATTDCSIGEVAGLTGYPNPLYFSRIFKKNTGLSPTDYRQKANQKHI